VLAITVHVFVFIVFATVITLFRDHHEEYDSGLGARIVPK